MAIFERPLDLMENEIVKKRFSRPQEIGNFIKAYDDKFMFAKAKDSPATLIEKNTFFAFLEYIEKFEYIEAF